MITDCAAPARNVSAETSGAAIVKNIVIANDCRTQAPTSMYTCSAPFCHSITRARLYIDSVLGARSSAPRLESKAIQQWISSTAKRMRFVGDQFVIEMRGRPYSPAHNLRSKEIAASCTQTHRIGMPRIDRSQDEAIEHVHKELAQEDDGIIRSEVSHVQFL